MATPDHPVLRDIKTLGYQIREHLMHLGHDIPQGHCLELAARIGEIPNWRQAIKEAAGEVLPPPPEPSEISNAEFRRMVLEQTKPRGPLAEQITVDEFREGVQTLLEVTRMRGTSGARVAAQVLLSTYNGESFQLDLTDLCLLSGEYYTAAITVIRGRVEVNMEPQRLVDQGDQVFGELWDRFIRLHVQNRWKRTCPQCYGSGKDPDDLDENGNEPPVRTTCGRCQGEGIVSD